MTTHPAFTPYNRHHHHQHHHHHHQQVAMVDDLFAHGAPRNRGSSVISSGSGGNGNSSKDSRWLTLEVCSDHLKGACPRKEDECMSAHLIKGACPAHQEQEGRVMCCYDFIKGKCHRKEPPCKFFHPPPHLREVLLFNGRQNLILKNLRLQQALGTVPFVQSNAVMPVIYATGGPPHMNTAAPSKMPLGDGPQQQPYHSMAPNSLASYWIINQGGMTYFYPVMLAPDSWVSVPANGMANCHGVPSPAVPGSLKQIEQSSIPFTTFTGGDELLVSSPWLQNGYHAASPPYYSCYGVSTDLGCMKRPCEFNYIGKVNTLS